jgi:hypothetical protein
MPCVAIKGSFCSTRNGCQFAAVVENGSLLFLDRHPRASYEGRNNGFEMYSLAIGEGTPWLEFFKEDGVQMAVVRRAGNRRPVLCFCSFRLAQTWVQERLSCLSTSGVAPH